MSWLVGTDVSFRSTLSAAAAAARSVTLPRLLLSPLCRRWDPYKAASARGACRCRCVSSLSMSHPSQCSSSARSSLSAEQLSPSPAAAAAATAARHALHSQRIVKPRSRLPPSSQARSASFASFASSSSSPPSAAAAAAPFSPGSLPAHTPFLVRLRHYLAGALLSLTSVSSLSNFTSSSHSFSSSPAWLLGSRYRSLANTAYHPVSGMQQQRQQQHCSSSSSHSADAASVDSSSLSVSRSSSSPSAAAGRAAVLSDVGSRFWFSYRSGFPPLSADPSMALSSDAGWGCMLRSTQMLFAYALTLHYLGRHWRRQSAIGPGGGNDKHTSSVNEQLQQQQQAYLSILSWFLDSPSAPYSIHSLLGAPYSSSSTLSSTAAASSSLSSSVPSPPSPSTPRAGEWFGPTATCHMLLRCRAAQVAAAGGESHIDVPAILVSDDGTLYEDELIRLCRPSSSSSLPLSPPSVSGSGDSEEARFRPVVLLIPVRLGADRINEAYIEPLLSCFQFGQSLGMMVRSNHSASKQASKPVDSRRHCRSLACCCSPLTVPERLLCCVPVCCCRAASLAPATGSSACRTSECCTSTLTPCSLQWTARLLCCRPPPARPSTLSSYTPRPRSSWTPVWHSASTFTTGKTGCRSSSTPGPLKTDMQPMPWSE